MMSHIYKTYGLTYVAILATVSFLIVHFPLMANTGISSLVIAILLGIVIGNAWHYPASFAPGIQFAAKRLLRLAIILYGFRVSFQQIASLGVHALVLDIIVVSLTLILGYLVGRKIFKLDQDLAILISAGAAICGAAAVLAVEDVLKSEPYKAVVAIGTVVLFGTISMFLYPFLHHTGLFGLSDYQFGIFAGASVHEVAQALVAGDNVSSDAGKIAVIVKMMRVLLLVPVLVVLSLIINRFNVIDQPLSKNTPKACPVTFSNGVGCEADLNEKRGEKAQHTHKYVSIFPFVFHSKASADGVSRTEPELLRFNKKNRDQSFKLTVPWFAVGFVLVIGFNSLQLLPASFVNTINQLDIILLTMAMGAIGIETKLSKLKSVGLKPLYLAIFLFGWLMCSVFMMVKFT